KIPIQGGKRYKVRFQARGQGGYVQLSFRGGDITGGWYGPDSVDLPWGREAALAVCADSAEWKPYSVVVKAPAGANQMLLYLRSSGKGPQAACYDNIVVEETQDAVAGGTLVNGDFAKG